MATAIRAISTLYGETAKTFESEATLTEQNPATSSEPTARGRRCSKTVKQNYRNYEY
jgi:hypothetical protein